MMVRRGARVDDTPERRARLQQEYAKLVRRAKTCLSKRPSTHTLYLRHDAVLRDPAEAARAVNALLGGGLPVEAMAAESSRSCEDKRRKILHAKILHALTTENSS